MSNYSINRKRSGIKLGSYLDKKDSKTLVRNFGEKIIVTKGENVSFVDLTDLRNRLKRLRANHSKVVKGLTGQILDDYTTLVSHVSLLYDTEEYTYLYKEVKKVFEDLKDFKAGTIGAYCAGCLMTNPLKGCSVICSTSLPRPKSEEGWACIEHPIFWAKFDGNKYVITRVNEIMGKSEGIIYMETSNIYGFSEEEKNFLKKLGLSKVSLTHYSEEGKELKELIPGFINVDALPVRNSKNVKSMESEDFKRSAENINNNIQVNGNSKSVVSNKATTTTTNNSDSNNGWWIFFIVIIAIILLFMFARRQR